jgi:hypothetical protein
MNFELTLSTQGPAVGRPRSREKTKRGVTTDPPFFCNQPGTLSLELISVVYTSIKPAPTAPDSAILINPKVFLYGRRQV